MVDPSKRDEGAQRGLPDDDDTPVPARVLDGLAWLDQRLIETTARRRTQLEAHRVTVAQRIEALREMDDREGVCRGQQLLDEIDAELRRRVAPVSPTVASADTVDPAQHAYTARLAVSMRLRAMKRKGGSRTFLLTEIVLDVLQKLAPTVGRAELFSPQVIDAVTRSVASVLHELVEEKLLEHALPRVRNSNPLPEGVHQAFTAGPGAATAYVADDGTMRVNEEDVQPAQLTRRQRVTLQEWVANVLQNGKARQQPVALTELCQQLVATGPADLMPSNRSRANWRYHVAQAARALVADGKAIETDTSAGDRVAAPAWVWVDSLPIGAEPERQGRASARKTRRTHD